MNTRLPVAVLGATGVVGQRFLQLLAEHPWFEVVALSGSERTAGRLYGESVRWVLDAPLPAQYAQLRVNASDAVAPVAIAFSALPGDVAREVEPLWAAAGALVCSNTSTYRMTADVPLLIPEVNPDHLQLLRHQRAQRGWTGGIVTNPNCSTIGLALALRALHDAFGVRQVMAATLQAVSGAGYPGVAALDIVDNVIPYIGGEEEKVESEPLKLLGRYAQTHIAAAQIAITAHCTRVPVLDGHTAMVSVALERAATPAQAAEALASFQAPPAVRGLPTAPAQPLVVRAEVDRPQPRRDRDAGGGMTVTVGRVRACPIMGLKFAVLVHNTIRGAAGGALVNAELAVVEGLVGERAAEAAG